MSLFFRQPIITKIQALSEDRQTEETVSLGQDLWSSLHLRGTRAVIWIKPAYSVVNSARTNDEEACMLCRAVCDPSTSGLMVPSFWFSKHRNIFQLSHFQHTLSDDILVELVKAEQEHLREIILTARTQEAFHMASTQGSTIENWLFQSSTIIREGEDIWLPASIFPSSTEAPSFYKYRVVQALPRRQGTVRHGTTHVVVLAPEGMQSVPTTELSGSRPGSWQESLEISESFLVSASLSAPKAMDATALSFVVEPLASPIDQRYDDVTLYIRTSDLRLLGVLNSDWILANHVESRSSRLLRVHALDGVDIERNHAMLSPSLLFNLCPSLPHSITVSSFPLGTDSPPVPTARSISLARIASPFSNDRKYESLCISHLQAYFATSRRLVKEGDVITLCVDVDSVVDPYWMLDNKSCRVGYPANTLVYFMVQLVEYESVGSDFEQNHGSPSIPPSLNVGCLVDVNSTRILQVGVQSCRIPDAYSYFDIGHSGSLDTGHLSQLLNASSLGDDRYSTHPSILITGVRGSGKFGMALQFAHGLGLHLVEFNCFEILSEVDSNIESLHAQFEAAFAYAPCLVVIRHLDAIRQSMQHIAGGGHLVWHDMQEFMDKTMKEKGAIIVATMDTTLPETSVFVSEIEQKALDEHQRVNLLIDLCSGNLFHGLAHDVSAKALGRQTAALVAYDIVKLILQTRILSVASTGCLVGGTLLQASHFEAALHKVRTSSTQSIGMPSVPNVQWADIGGLSEVKNEILDTVQLPLDCPELFQQGLKQRSGVLLYGPPGTGKTLLAKAVATSCSLNFLSVKGPELLNMYIGESEANVRRVFQKARDAKPCVVFFDELDSVAPKRGHHGDSGGVMDRIVSQLLAELDGINTGEVDIFVIGATNRPDLIDSALLRPGRFDRMLYLGVSNGHDAQLDILKALTRKFKLCSNTNLYAIACKCPMTYTGADFYALCADAMLQALSRKVSLLEAQRCILNSQPEFQHYPVSSQLYISDMVSEADLEVSLSMEDFMVALQELIPSVSDEEIAYYANIQHFWHTK